MRAARIHEFGPSSNLVVEEIDEPKVRPGEVLIEVAAVSVNFPDLLVVKGEYQNLPDRPFSPGKEAAGTVVGVGEGVEDFAAGDRVLTLMEYGGYAEQLVVPEDLAMPIPTGISFEKAAAAGLVFSTAYFAFHRRVDLKANDTVLITGAAGGVGSAGVQLAKLRGAKVIALVHGEAKADFARELGADVVITSEADTLREDVMEATDGRGVDVVLDMLGGDFLSQAIRCTAWEGRVIVVGFAAGGQNPIKPGHLLVKNISIVGLQGSDYRDRTPALMRKAMTEVFELMSNSELDIPIDRTFPLDRVSEALDHVSDRLVRGKVVITMGNTS